MRCVDDIRLVGEHVDEFVLKRVTRLSLWLFAGGVALIAAAFLIVPLVLGVPSPVEPLGLGWLVGLVAAVSVPLVLHELVHGACFKLLAPRDGRARVTFGHDIRKGLLYACAEGVVYTRARYVVVALAPVAVVTAGFIVLGAATGWWLLASVGAVVHLAGCAGDIVYVVLILGDKRVRWCEDSAEGVRLYAEDEEA